MPMPRWSLALFTLLAAMLLVACNGDTEADDADLEAAIAFLDAAIRVDIRPSEGDILYSRIEDDGLDAQTPRVVEVWYRIGPNLMAAELLYRTFDEDGNVLEERHEMEESPLAWGKDIAYGARVGLAEGSSQLIDLTDETVTVEQRLRVDEWSPTHRLGIEDPIEDGIRFTIDRQGILVEHHRFVLTGAGEEIPISHTRQSRNIVDDMPTPTPR